MSLGIVVLEAERKIPFSYREARELNLDHKTFKRALNILENNGFIVCSQRGGLLKNPSLYNLSNDWYMNNELFKNDKDKYLREHSNNTLKRKEIMNRARENKIVNTKVGSRKESV